MTLSLVDAVDTHVHSAPDVVARIQTDLEVVQSALGAGMRGVVLKNHHFPTADRARLAGGCFPQVDVMGGIVLNAAVGGLNLEAVRASAGVGGRVVWLPTTSAGNHQLTPIVEVTRDGVPVPGLDSILDFIAADDLVLATGHLAPQETVAVVERAQERGVRRILVTHPELPIVNMPIEIQKQLARRGVLFERCYYSILAGVRASGIVEQIRAAGVDSTVLSTDLGQSHNPPPVDGFRAYGEVLMYNGITESEWWTMTRTNPARLLGLD